MATGTVKTVLSDKGFGFITPDDAGAGEKSDLFFHHTSIQDGQIEQYKQGDRVSYQAEPDTRDPSRTRATNVRRVTE
ncbi:MAG: cold-shock protein [Thermomicrobiales bacterium]